MTRHLLTHLTIAALLLSLTACGEEDKAPPEVTEGYGVKLDESEIQATVDNGKLTASFILQRKGAGTFGGTLRLETRQLGVETSLKNASTPFTLDAATKKVTVTLDAPTYHTPGDLGAYVLRYRVELPEGALYGSRSLFMALKRSGLTVIGNNRFAAGEKGSLRILITNPNTGVGVLGAPVEVKFTPSSGSTARSISAGKTDSAGLYLASFTFTAQDTGAGTISVVAGEHKSSHPILIEQERQLLVTTDKPLYQPGQTVYIRALAMRQPQVTPVATEPLLLEVEDPKGNKLFKKTTKTDSYGIAAFRFDLARLLGLGQYTVRVTMGTTVRSKTFKVDKYTLPKFKVKVTTNASYFSPGATVSGTLQADYYFGKPVADAAVVLTGTDSAGKKIAELQGKTDAKGQYNFQVLAPMDKTLILSGAVTDSSGAEGLASASVLLTNDKFLLQLIPARKRAPAGGEVSFFALLTDPAGKPMAGTLDVSGSSTATHLTFGGKTTTQVTVPGTTGLVEIKGELGACGGSQVSITVIYGGKKHTTSMSCAKDDDILTLSTDRALYKEGDTMKVSLAGPTACTQAGLEVVRHNAVVHTATIKMSAGKGAASIPLSKDMRRTIEVKASCMLEKTIAADQQLAYVAGKDTLNIKVTTDKAQYRPAGKAKVTLQLTDQAGKAAPGAMGVHVVDEALFALTEFKPGLERKTFFMEQSVIDAGKDVRFVSPDVMLAAAPTAADQLRARILFSSAGQEAKYPINYRTANKDAGAAISASRAGINAFINNLRQAFADKFGDMYSVEPDDEVKAGKWVDDRLDGTGDDFGTLYKVERNGNSLTLTSAGMDEKFSTNDDLTVYMTWYVRHPYPGKHDGGMSSKDMGGWYADAMTSADSGMYPPPGDSGATKSDSGAGASVIIRQEFPETLYVNPALITDSAGKATIDLDLADSITTWRLSSIAHTMAGQLGSTTSGITVFQEFFVDALLPKHLLQDDEVVVPVPVYNYTSTSQTVTVTAKSESWFTLTGSAVQTVTVPAKSMTRALFSIKATKVGTFGFTVTGVSASDSDGVKRAVTVLPDGVRKEVIFSGALKPGSVAHTVNIPTAAIDGASELFVRVFPGLLAEVVEGFESLFKKPYGCFEQTSSTTYPNVLVLSYLKAAGKTNASLEAKAKGYIDDGYQRLIKYEVSGGGFSLWGSAPANIVLSAFGLMEFSDMAKVRYVDPALIARTQSWVVNQQQANGSFALASKGYYEIPGNLATDTLRVTAYTAWALQQSGYTGAALTSALAYVRGQIGSSTDTYTMAVAANALLAANTSDTTGLSLLTKLKTAATADGDKYKWTSAGCSVTYGYGKSMETETTALVLGAFLLAKDSSAYTAGGLKWLAAAKGGYGGYGTTQATILALRTLLLSLAAKGGDKALGTITVSHNGLAAGTSTVDPTTSDVTRLFDLKTAVIEGANKVSLGFSGSGELAYQVVGVYYMPHGTSTGTGPLTFSVKYDKTSLKVGESIAVTATVGNTGTGSIPTVMMKVGLPPGFSVKLEDLTSAKTNGIVNLAEEKGPYLILYLGNLDAATPQSVTFKMKSALAVKAKAPASTAYPYYTPEFVQVVDTQMVTVTP